MSSQASQMPAQCQLSSLPSRPPHGSLRADSFSAADVAIIGALRQAVAEERPAPAVSIPAMTRRPSHATEHLQPQMRFGRPGGTSASWQSSVMQSGPSCLPVIDVYGSIRFPRRSTLYGRVHPGPSGPNGIASSASTPGWPTNAAMQRDTADRQSLCTIGHQGAAAALRDSSRAASDSLEFHTAILTPEEETSAALRSLQRYVWPVSRVAQSAADC